MMNVACGVASCDASISASTCQSVVPPAVQFFATDGALSASQSGTQGGSLRLARNGGDGMWVSTVLGSVVMYAPAGWFRQNLKWIRLWQSAESVLWNV